MKRYKIWKASIEEYRVQDTVTGEIKVLKDFTLLGCILLVDINLYNDAKARNFANTGNPFDYFAWIEADKVKKGTGLLKDRVFYNPFKSSFFRDRSTNEIKQFANKLVINANTLSYE